MACVLSTMNSTVLRAKAKVSSVRELVDGEEDVDAPGRPVLDELAQPHRRRAHGLAHLGMPVDERRRRLLEHLLLPPLRAALALAAVDHLALAVAEDLHLDVQRARDELLDEDAGV